MKLFLSSVFLCLLVGTPAFSRQQQQQEQQQQEERQKQTQDQQAEKSKQEKQQQQDEEARQGDKAKEDKQQKQADMKEQQKDQPKQQKDLDKQQKEQEKQQAKQPPANPPHNRGNEQLQSDQHGGYQPRQGRAIPAEKFRADFGRQHHFHVRHDQHDGRFQYAGFWFTFEQPWPARWTDGDDFYVDYIDDDYYLCDVEHPQVRVLVIVVS